MFAKRFAPLLLIVPFVTANCGDMASPIDRKSVV